MEDLVKMSEILENYILEVAEDFFPSPKREPQMVSEVIIDPVRRRFLLMHIGWLKEKRVYGCLLHLSINDGKVWVEHNGTELMVGDDLERRGIPKSQMVFGFHPPNLRQYTDFAVG